MKSRAPWAGGPTRVLTMGMLGVLLAQPALARPRSGRTAPPAAGAAAAAAASTGPGLVLSSVTEGAEVFVDGEFVGVVPLQGPVSVAPGEHTIKVHKAGFAPFIDVFKVPKKGQAKLEAELVPVAGVLAIASNVEKARVFIDGQFACEAPCVTEMQVGARAVQVSKGGYKDWFENVASVAGQSVSLDVKLEELPVGLNPYKPAPPPPPKWYEKWWVWTLAAVGAGAVVTAVVVPVQQSQRDPVREFGAGYTFTVPLPMP